jgi:putative peptide zinc metalloprotease protein
MTIDTTTPLDELAGNLPLNPPSSGPNEYRLIPLSIQREGDSYLVGSLELNRFYQLPEVGVKVIRLLQEGLSLAEVKGRVASETNDDVDIDDFLSTLTEIGFVYSGPPRAEAQSSSMSQKRLEFARRVARVVFSLPGAGIYSLVVIYAFFCVATIPHIRPSLGVFFFPEHLTASLLLLLVLYLPIVMLHEFGHMLAAARSGISSHLGIGTRLWTIVIEADLTGVLSLPRSKRYLPLLAGLLTDVFSVSILIIAVNLLLKSHASSFATQLVQALIMQTLLVMSWQTNVFLRTDLYYVLCTALAYPDLDRDARLYLRTIAYRVSLGRFGMKALPDQMLQRMKVVRFFALVWLVGRLGSLYFLIVIAVPTLFLYAHNDYLALKGASMKAVPYDSMFFTLISASMLLSGLWMWLSQMKSRRLKLMDQA